MNSHRRIAAAFALMAATVTFTALGADKRETRAVSGFHAIGLAAPIHVDVVQGDSEGLVLEGDEAALAELETVVEQGVLKIRTRSHHEPRGMQKVRARVSARTVEALRSAGSGDIDAETLRSGDLQIGIAGSGDIRIGALSASSLDVSIAGSGNVTVAGTVATVSTSIAGSGDLKAAKLETRAAKVKIAGSGDAAVWAKQSVDVKIMGSGDVVYYGDPAVERTILGSGSVRRAGASPS